jgi:predicted secreted protein
MANAINSQNTLFKRGDGGSPETFVAVSEVVKIGGPSGSASIIDVTHLTSTAREKVLGLADEGQITLDLNYIPNDTQQANLRTDRANKSLRNFQIVIPTPAQTISFAAYVTGFSLDFAVDAKVACSITLEITGAVTFA